MKIEKAEVMNWLNKIAEIGFQGFNEKVYAKDWEGYGKNRTYFKIYETSNTSKHSACYDCGYYDNISGEYVEGKVGFGYTLGGSKIA